MKVSVPILDKKKKQITSDTLNFLKSNVYNVTEVTRQKKLTEMLDHFSHGQSEEVFIIQNAKNKEARAAFVDLDYFNQLLTYKEAIEEAMDDLIEEEATLRRNEHATLSLSEAFDEDDIDFAALLKEIGE